MMAPRDDWNLRMVRAREARALLPGADLPDWGAVAVGHLDTGYTRHLIFGDWAAGGSWVRVADGVDLVDEDADARDPCDYDGNPGHGTRTASVLCGVAADPAVQSEIGVASRLPLVPCRVVRSVVLMRERDRARVGAGILHALGKGCGVVSISLGVPFFAPGTDGGMGDAVDRAYEAGTIVVAAAGQVIDSVTYPAKYHRTIAAGGVTWQRRIWFDYRAGRERVDVWAPADGVLRADPLVEHAARARAPIEGDDPGVLGSGSGSSSSGALGKGSGTSYATVHVAAAAAMWLRVRGDELDAAYGRSWRRVEAFRLLLRRTGMPVNGPQPPNGTGVLDIERLLRAPLPRAGDLARSPGAARSFA